MWWPSPAGFVWRWRCSSLAIVALWCVSLVWHRNQAPSTPSAIPPAEDWTSPSGVCTRRGPAFVRTLLALDWLASSEMFPKVRTLLRVRARVRLSGTGQRGRGWFVFFGKFCVHCKHLVTRIMEEKRVGEWTSERKFCSTISSTFFGNHLLLLNHSQYFSDFT